MKKENRLNLNQLRDSMSRELKTLSDIKNLFDISEEHIIKWLNDFRDCFSEYAQRKTSRKFCFIIWHINLELILTGY